MTSGNHRFETTLWGEVMLAAKEPSSTDGRRALSRLCEIYWYPVYTYVRRRGAFPEDAKDLTQGFFEHILGTQFFSRADPERGKFRNFLLGAVRNYLSDQWDKRSTQRRGGRLEKVAIDLALAEQMFSVEPTSTNDPTKAFDRSWASSVISRAFHILEEEQRSAGKADSFLLLKDFLQRQARAGEYEAIAEQLGMRKGAISTAVHRLTERLSEIVKQSVRETVVNSEMADEELRFLYSALNG